MSVAAKIYKGSVHAFELEVKSSLNRVVSTIDFQSRGLLFIFISQ